MFELLTTLTYEIAFDFMNLPLHFTLHSINSQCAEPMLLLRMHSQIKQTFLSASNNYILLCEDKHVQLCNEGGKVVAEHVKQSKK